MSYCMSCSEQMLLHLLPCGGVRASSFPAKAVTYSSFTAVFPATCIAAFSARARMVRALSDCDTSLLASLPPMCLRLRLLFMGVTGRENGPDAWELRSAACMPSPLAARRLFICEAALSGRAYSDLSNSSPTSLPAEAKATCNSRHSES